MTFKLPKAKYNKYKELLKTSGYSRQERNIRKYRWIIDILISISEEASGHSNLVSFLFFESS